MERPIQQRWLEKGIALALALLSLATTKASAQDNPQYRLEVGGGIGLLTYEGDFNGNLFGHMQPVATLVGRYNFDPYKDLRLSLSMGKIKGSSTNADTYFPDFAENVYQFNNTLVDLSLMFEYNFWPYGTGRDYRGARRLVPYVAGGLGATYAKGKKNVFTANVPLGIGIKYKVNERLNLGVDWNIHFSLSDELDGVKDPYLVKSSGLFKNTDCYSMLEVTLTYSFQAKCKTCNKEE